METTNEKMSGEFDRKEIEPLAEKVVELLKDVPGSIATLALVAAMLTIAKSEADADNQDYDGFEFECQVKDFHFTVEARRGIMADSLEELIQEALRRDDPKSEDFCDCPSCEERRKVMAFHNIKPVIH